MRFQGKAFLKSTILQYPYYTGHVSQIFIVTYSLMKKR